MKNNNMRNPENIVITTLIEPSQALSSVLSNTRCDLTSWGSEGVDPNSDMIEFFELILVVLGVDLTFEEFQNMSSDERVSLIRDIKIKKVLC
jgi:hypothetical protein